MAQVINSNIASLFSQRNLNQTNNSLNSALQRLSSGKRINSAKDDAAGIAIASRFTAQIRGTNQGSRNSADAISLSQTAEGALDEISSNSQRIRELSVQSANATNSDTDRQALQTEVDQLTQEISRIVDSASFSGTELFTSGDELTFQVGAGSSASNKITIALTDLTASSSVPFDTANTILTSMKNPISQALLSPFGEIVSSGAGRSILFGNEYNYDIAGSLEDLSIQAGYTYGIDWSVDLAATSVTLNTPSMLDNEAIKTAYDMMNVTMAPANQQPDGVNALAAAEAYTASLDTGSGGLNTYSSSGARTINISDASSATAAISMIDNDLVVINANRAQFGAYQNRFESVIRNAENLSENLSASRSRIEDADFAIETANLTKFQILQQAGTSVLSQANALPQSVLSLLA